MDQDTKQLLHRRLKRAEGQVAAVRRMVEEDNDCVDILLQISAVRGALGKIGELLLGNHLETCVADAIRSGDAAAQKEQIDDVMEVFSRFGGIVR